MIELLKDIPTFKAGELMAQPYIPEQVFCQTSELTKVIQDVMDTMGNTGKNIMGKC